MVEGGVEAAEDSERLQGREGSRQSCPDLVPGVKWPVTAEDGDERPREQNGEGPHEVPECGAVAAAPGNLDADEPDVDVLKQPKLARADSGQHEERDGADEAPKGRRQAVASVAPYLFKRR